MNNSTSLVGSQLGKYQVQAEIGQGGMSTVYRGYDPALDRHVAIKVLAPHLAWQENSVERFLREARAAARLEHPNIVHIYDVGQERGWYYYVMEYLPGKTLTDVVQQQGSLPPNQVLAILRPLANALDFAHHAGLVHRDIKPANVIAGQSGRVTLTDFGIARAVQDTGLTATGMVVGTPEYLSPEQAQGLPADARSDQYSLAVVAYQMLIGSVPFHADNTAALMFKIAYEPPPPVGLTRRDLPRQVDYVLAKALAKAPDDRYPSTTIFVEDLERALAGQKVMALPPKPTPQRPESATVLSGAAAAAARPPLEQPKGRRRVPIWIWIVGGLALVLLLLGLALALGGGGPGATPTAIVLVVTPVPPETPTEPPASPVPANTPVPPTDAPPQPTAASSPVPSRVLEETQPVLPTPTATSPPAATATATETATATATATVPPTSTPTVPHTSEPSSKATAAPPAPIRVPTAVSIQYPPPSLVDPPDAQVFSPNDKIVLRWEPVGSLQPEAYYEIVVTFSPAAEPAQTWTDETPWVKESNWTLSEHNYLPSISADGKFHWSVRVMHRTGEDAQGRPVGAPLSPMSDVRTLIWQAPSEGGGGGSGGRPTSPPP